MTAIKAIITLTLAAVILTGQVHAEPSDVLIHYYWVTSEEVWLWQPSGDVLPLKATFNKSKQQWTIQPEQFSPTWRSTFERIAQGYHPQVQMKDVVQVMLQGFVLAKLRNEHPRIVWAHPYPPAAQIFFLKRGEQKAQVAIILDEEAPNRKIFEFTRNEAGIWSKDSQQSLSLPTIFGVEDNPAELARIFRFYAGTAAENDWPKAWDSWIKQTMLSGARFEQFTYADSSGERRWVFREAQDTNSELETQSRRMPAKLTPVPVPPIAQSAVPGSSQSWFSLPYLLPGLLLLIALAFVVPKSRRWLLSLVLDSNAKPPVLPTEQPVVSKMEQPVAPKMDPPLGILPVQQDETTAHLPITADTLNDLHRLAEMAPLLVQEAEMRREQALNDYRAQLGVKEDSDDQIRGFIELGRLAEDLSRKASRTEIPEKIVQLIAQRPNESSSHSEWLRFYPEVIAAYDCAWHRAEQDRAQIRSTFAEQEKKHADQLNKIKAKVAANAKSHIKELETKAGKQANEIEDLNVQISNLTTHGTSLKAEISDLNSKLTRAYADAESSVSITEDLRKKLTQVEVVRQVSHEVRRSLQAYHNHLMIQTREIRSLSILSSLLNFSIGQMCFGLVGERTALTRASAHNILLLTRGIRQSGSSSSILEVLVTNLVPDVATTLQYFTNDRLGGTTYDEPLFRDFLNWLKTDTGQDLSPFFVDLDSHNQQTLVHVTAG